MAMTPGIYYVGDLCYVMHDCWDEVCGQSIEGQYKLKDGRSYAIHRTAYGDGLYSSNIGEKFSVDSGTIGCIPIKDILDDVKLQEILYLGAIVYFPYSFDTENQQGLIKIGHITIDTGYDEFEEFDEDCEVEDED